MTPKERQRFCLSFFLVVMITSPDASPLIRNANIARQYDFLLESIIVGIPQGPVAFDKPFLWALNHLAVANLNQFGGRFREEPVYLDHGQHTPPPFQHVDSHVDRLIDTIRQDWTQAPAIGLAAYVLWRLNWIHPFIDGNGRTARAACYFILCLKLGRPLSGKKILPQRIQESQDEYIKALQESDRAWETGQIDLSRLEVYIHQLVVDQITDQS